MFSDDTSCSCHSDLQDQQNIKSLPVIPSSSSSSSSSSPPHTTTSSSFPTSCCCSPRDGVPGEGGDCSAVPSNHYKSPHEVDGEYSYAYR